MYSNDNDNNFLPSSRISAIIALICFIPVTFTFFMPAIPFWADYPGILFHLALFLLVAKIPAPSWAKVAGFAWLVLDVTVGVMTLDHINGDIYMPIRLGGHIFGGMWILVSSLFGPRSLKIVGCLAGGWLFTYSFLSPFLPFVFLAPASLMVILWLFIIAWKGESLMEVSAT